MKVLLLLAIMVSSAVTQAAQRFKIGDQVIYYDRAIAMRGQVVDAEAGGGLKIDFGNWSENLYYGRQTSASQFLPYRRRVVPYRHTDQLVVRNYVGYPVFTLSIGQPVIYKNSATWVKGVIWDLTEDGFARVDFGSSYTNDIYQYVDAYSYLTPATDADLADIKSSY